MDLQPARNLGGGAEAKARAANPVGTSQHKDLPTGKLTPVFLIKLNGFTHAFFRGCFIYFC